MGTPQFGIEPKGTFDDDIWEYNFVTCDPSDSKSYMKIYKDAEGKAWDGKTLPTMLCFNEDPKSTDGRPIPHAPFGIALDHEGMVYAMAPDHSSLWVFAPLLATRHANDHFPFTRDRKSVCLEGTDLKNFLYGDEECLYALLSGNYTLSRKALCREYATVDGLDASPRTQRMYFREVLDTNNTNYRMIEAWTKNKVQWDPPIVTYSMNCPSHFLVQHSGPTMHTKCCIPMVFIGHPHVPFVTDINSGTHATDYYQKMYWSPAEGGVLAPNYILGPENNRTSAYNTEDDSPWYGMLYHIHFHKMDSVHKLQEEIADELIYSEVLENTFQKAWSNASSLKDASDNFADSLSTYDVREAAEKVRDEIASTMMQDPILDLLFDGDMKEDIENQFEAMTRNSGNRFLGAEPTDRFHAWLDQERLTHTHEKQNAPEQIVAMPIFLHDHEADQAEVVSGLQKGEMRRLASMTANTPSAEAAHQPQLVSETHQPEDNVLGGLIGGIGGQLLQGVLGGGGGGASNLLGGLAEGGAEGGPLGILGEAIGGGGLLEGAASLLSFL